MSSILPLRLSGATVHRHGKRLIGPVDLSIEADQFVIILGPNGSGKTTLMRAMHGLLRLSGGEVSFSSPPQKAREAQSFVSQHPIMMRRSLRDNLAYPLALSGMPRKQAAIAATEWGTRIGLASALDQSAPNLSGGEKQKAAVARALIRAPELLFLDEPCANLDGHATRDIEALLLSERTESRTFVMSTHDLGQARRLATQVVFLLNGCVHESGTAEAFFRAPKTKQAAAFLQGDIV